ncbi:DUF3037 domain-containing protein [Aridibaculum aurantiacum]|uniref:DUF3037 domain-containing protein n=1 Tax=Aridibaculum aurantiacum TaxID=2810307 RepID=UPI001A962DB2|nr:DUF3037 domain-containing protein [Aridibaculum aurantiacum]
MPAKHLFEYAVIRVVPRVEREEFMNVGVIVYCRDLKFLQIKYELKAERLRAFSAGIDLEELEHRLQAFFKICCGKPDGGPIGELPLASRFRWLAAARSTIVQVSPTHPGLTHDPQQALEKLYHQMVL